MGDFIWDSQFKDLAWLRPDGSEMAPEDWQKPWITSFAFMLGGDAIHRVDAHGRRLIDDGLLVLMNAHHEPITFRLPDDLGAEWFLELDTTTSNREGPFSGEYEVGPRSLALFRQPLPADLAREAAAAPSRVARQERQRWRRRAGVVVPLFSLRSKTTWGAGDISDIPRFAEWAAKAGYSLLQLLPVNEANAGDRSPYAAVSAFALDPVYLAPDACEDFVAAGGAAALGDDARRRLEAASAARLVDWQAVSALKRQAADLAFGRFLRDEWQKKSARCRQLGAFIGEHRSWLDDYALFVVLHERFGREWLAWPRRLRDREPAALAAARAEHQEGILRAQWLQWQLDLQWRSARREASAAGVALMGDLPFVPGLDSADVWARRDLFRVDERVGAPPDETSPDGQDWGLPAYDWEAFEADDFAWIKGRAMRAGDLFGAYRVDHALGFYRTFVRSADGEVRGFTPADEGAQVSLGERIMRMMNRWGEVIAEDLGAVPPFLRPSLEKIGIPGYRVLRWEKDGDQYRDPASWPEVSVATNATHDTDTTAGWYDGLAPEEREALRQIPALESLDPAKRFDDATRDLFLRAVYQAPSNIALVPFQDAMGVSDRINTPGTVDAANWSYRLDRTVEALLDDRDTLERLASLATDTGRTPRRG
jgi:4-alpha-glucanotransferase